MAASFLMFMGHGGGHDAAAPRAAQDGSRGLVQRLLIADMGSSSEVTPHGVPTSYGWGDHPRVRDPQRAQAFSAFTAWGQLYRCAKSRVTPTRSVELRDMRSWAFLRSTRRWTLLQRTSEISGASYPENFHGSSTAGHFVRRGPSGTAVRLTPGFNLHFWPGPRAALQVQDVEAVAVVVSARLAATRRLHRRVPCVVLSAGGDFWRTRGASPSGTSKNAEAGIGRFKRVGPGWRVYSMTTAGRRLLRRYPLPYRAPSVELR